MSAANGIRYEDSSTSVIACTVKRLVQLSIDWPLLVRMGSLNRGHCDLYSESSASLRAGVILTEHAAAPRM